MLCRWMPCCGVLTYRCGVGASSFENGGASFCQVGCSHAVMLRLSQGDVMSPLMQQYSLFGVWPRLVGKLKTCTKSRSSDVVEFRFST